MGESGRKEKRRKDEKIGQKEKEERRGECEERGEEKIH